MSLTTAPPPTQALLKELLDALLRNPNLPQLMDSLSATTATAQLSTTPLNHDASPPPYPFAEMDAFSDSDDDEDAPSPSPATAPSTTLHIDGSTHIIGSRNGITTPSPAAVAATVVAALRQASTGIGGARSLASAPNVTVRVDCGVHIRGDGNLMGAWTGPRGKQGHGQGQQQQQQAQGQAVEENVGEQGKGVEEGVRGRKRAAEDEGGEEGPEAKVAKREE